MPRGYWKLRSAIAVANEMLAKLRPALRNFVPDDHKEAYDKACRDLSEALVAFQLIPIQHFGQPDKTDKP